MLALLTTAGCGHRAPARPVAAPAPTTAPVVRPALPDVLDPLLGGSVAHPREALTVYDRPDGKPLRTLGLRTALDGPQGLLVAKYAPGWVLLHLPMRPNTATGWVRQSLVTITVDPWSIQVSRAQHLLIVRRSGTVTARYPVAIGAPATPTPAGLFYVTDLIATGDPHGAFGPAALGLSGRSDVIKQFAGADGVLGIHGTSAQWSVGRSVSHGCIRMRNADSLTLLGTVPVGTPVVIT